MSAAYSIAGIDVHKRVIMVAVADVSGIRMLAPEEAEEDGFRTAKFGTTASGLAEFAQWLEQAGVSEVVMESTAQYWWPVWLVLEGKFRQHLAQAQANAAPRGRKTDFGDAKRLVRRVAAGELRLSYVPEPEQRQWRLLTQARFQLTRARVRLQAQIESLLEATQIKLSSFLTDLLGLSGRRILGAIAHGESDPDVLAALASPQVRTSRETLRDALRGSVLPVHRVLLRQELERLSVIERQMEDLEQELDHYLEAQAPAVERLLGVPGIGARSAYEIVAQIGPDAAKFPTPANLASWIGVCPGRKESAGISSSNRSPKGNSAMRRVLTPGRARRHQSQRQHLRAQVPATAAASRFQKSHLGSGPQDLHRGVESPARRPVVPGAEHQVSAGRPSPSPGADSPAQAHGIRGNH